jgi:hypothetical protein
MKQNQIFAAVVVLITVIGGTAGAITYFAKDTDLQQVEFRLEKKIQGDNILRIQERIWQLEDRYQGRDCSEWIESDREEYRNLKSQLEMLKKEMDMRL